MAERAREEARQRGEEIAEPEGAPPDPADSRWSATDMLLALLVDEIRGLNWVYRSAHSKTAPAAPPQVRRPGAGRKPLRPHETTLTLAQRRRLDPRLRDDSRDPAGGEVV
jgi:hypothetical protein